MCGIAGFSLQKKIPTHASLQAMLNALAHRGPDGEGHVFHHHDAIGHRRLAIIDLEGGKQPIENSRYVVAVNGEIYNYLELKNIFPSYPFQTHCDSEILLPLFAHYKTNMLSYLRGMYAFALYDKEEKRLFLGRDPFGIKPLYYQETSEGFFFASEITALFEGSNVSPQIDEEGRDELLQLRFTSGRRTPFKNVWRVLPGEIICIQKGKIISRALYDTPLHQLESENYTEFETRFTQSTQVHLQSDVPIGLFLSGGLDSRAILMSFPPEILKNLSCFTTSFPTAPKMDESKVAKEIAQIYGAPLTEVPFTPEDFWKLLIDAIPFIDDPFFDPAVLLLMKMASVAKKQGIKVIFSGEGADECIGGYRRYQKASWPTWIGGRLFRKKGNFDKSNILKTPSIIFKKALEEKAAFYQNKGYTSLTISQLIDCETWLGALLSRLDRALMANGIEGRVPFVDRELSPYLLGLPDNKKIHFGHRKWILKNWIHTKHPHPSIWKKKQGFRYPNDLWVFDAPFDIEAWLCKQPCIQELCYIEEIKLLFSKRKKGFLVWSLLFYALWHAHHIEKEKNYLPFPK